MIRKQDFERLTKTTWELSADYRPDMNVPVRVFASERLLEASLGDRSFEQAANAAALPGLVGHVAVMPDVHQGYGFPIGGIAAANRDGVRVTGQVGCRPIGVLMGLNTSINPFTGHPAWAALAALEPEARRRRLGADEGLRRRLVDERPDNGHTRWMAEALTRCSQLDDPPSYEPEPGATIARRAADQGQDPWALALDIIADGETLLFWPFENYSSGSLDEVREMLLSEHTVCGLGDGGAHVATICDASYPTTLLTH